ncbi:MAG: STAS domain-containing protein [Planctomycetota bacterium]
MRLKSSDAPDVVDGLFTLNAGALCALGDVQRGDLRAFKDACTALRDCGQQSVFIDFSRCSYISSLFIGELAEAVMQMTASGKDVHVVVSPEIGKTLHMARLYHLFTFEISSADV